MERGARMARTRTSACGWRRSLRMDPSRWPELRAILESTLELPAGERLRRAAQVCGADAELHAELVSLLSAHDDATFLEMPGGALRDSWPGRRLGAWLLTRRLGEGGMAAVYEAERAD